jgi:hypothetical protein
MSFANELILYAEQEKLPYELGWSAKAQVTEAEDLFAMTARIINSTVWPTKIKARLYAGFHGGIVAKHSGH